MNLYSKAQIIEHMKSWFLSHYEDISESTPRDDGEWVFIWGDPITAQEALDNEFWSLFSEKLIEDTAQQLTEEHDIFEWVPVPQYEEDDADETNQATKDEREDAGADGESGREEAP